MTLEDYIKEQHELIDEFEQAWREGRSKTPGQYPTEMNPGDWDEQYIAFLQIARRCDDI